jgi:hypothetical protein
VSAADWIQLAIAAFGAVAAGAAWEAALTSRDSAKQLRIGHLAIAAALAGLRRFAAHDRAQVDRDQFEQHGQVLGHCHPVVRQGVEERAERVPVLAGPCHHYSAGPPRIGVYVVRVPDAAFGVNPVQGGELAPGRESVGCDQGVAPGDDRERRSGRPVRNGSDLWLLAYSEGRWPRR